MAHSRIKYRKMSTVILGEILQGSHLVEFTVLELHNGLYILEPGCLIAYSLSALDAGIDILGIARQKFSVFYGMAQALEQGMV